MSENTPPESKEYGNLSTLTQGDGEQSQLKAYSSVQKYRCKLSRIPVSRPINGQDACSPDKPANLTLEKLKLHYVVHYMLRGTWSDIVPEEVDEGRVEAYKCNICQKKFKNNYDKKEFPARGSVICHIATDHGQLIEAMKNDIEIDMQSEIQLLSKLETPSLTNGRSKTNKETEVPSNKLVSSIESILWRNDKKRGEKPCIEPPLLSSSRIPNISNCSEKVSITESKRITTSSQATLPSEKLVSNVNVGMQPKAFYSKESRSRPFVIECPRCDEFQGNSDPASLRLHIFHHYKDHWMKRVESLEQGSDNRYFCDVCPKRKSVTGATPEGAKLAAVCHFSIQHGELRQVLKEDDELNDEFISDLYWDVDHPSEKNRNCSYYLSQTAFVKKVKPTGASADKKISKRISAKSTGRYPKNNKRRNKYSSDESEEEIMMTSESSSGEGEGWSSKTDSGSDIASSRNKRGKLLGKMRDKFRQGSKKGTSAVHKSTKGAAGIPGMPNENYIRKRKKVQISLEDLENDYSSSDGEWKNDKFKKGKNRKMSRLHEKGDDLQHSASSNLSEIQLKTRVLPRRAVTMNKKTIVDSGAVDSDFESEDNE